MNMTIASPVAQPVLGQPGVFFRNPPYVFWRGGNVFELVTETAVDVNDFGHTETVIKTEREIVPERPEYRRNLSYLESIEKAPLASWVGRMNALACAMNWSAKDWYGPDGEHL